jgi:hypothetical protein
MDELRMVFLDAREFEGGAAVRGGALVTDVTTEPLEFRCTSPVRPTLLQKTLWGGRLADHIASQLIGKPLIDALSNSPSIVIVRRAEFVELRGLLRCPLVQLLKNEELAKASPLSLDSQGDDVLGMNNGHFEPVIIKVHRKHPDDLEVVRGLLAESAGSHNLLEPFHRIENALDLIQQQESAKPGK